MYNYTDKFKRKLDVGDIVACTCSYYHNIHAGKITLITENAVSFVLYRNDKSSWDPMDLDVLKEEPKGWRRWTKTPEDRLIILRKHKNK